MGVATKDSHIGGEKGLYKGTLLLIAQLSRSQGGVMLAESLMGPGAV